MKTGIDSGRAALMKDISVAAVFLAALISLVSLFGWATDILRIARIDSDYVPMAPSTAICFLLLSLALAFRVFLPGHAPRIVRQVAAALVLLIGVVLLGEFLVEAAGWEPDIEQWLVESTDDPEGFVIGRMSPLTALLFILLAVSALMPATERGRNDPGFLAGQGTAAAVLLTAVLLLVGYWYGSPLLYGGDVTPVALPTAVAFVLICLGILLETPRSWLARWLTSGSVAARFTRLVVPFTVTAILLIGWLHLSSELVNQAIGFAITSLITAAVVAALIFLGARRIQAAVDAGERSLRERVDFAESLVESSSAWIWQTDTDLNHTYTNAFVRSCLGYEPDEFLGRDTMELVHPEDRDLMRVIVREALAHKRGWSNKVLRWRHKDGSWRHIETSGNALLDAGGKVVGLQGVDRDVSEQEAAAAALRESEERLRRSQEIASLGSWELDPQKNELTWSDEVFRIFGLQPQGFEVTYEAFLECVHPDDREAVDEAYGNSLRDDRDSYEILHRIIRHDNGEERTVHEKCEHFRDESGEITRSVGMVHDITDRVATELTIRRQNRNLELLLEVGQSLTSTIELDRVLQAIVESAVRMGDLGSGAIYLLDQDELRLGATIPALPEGFPEELRRTPLGDHPHIDKSITDAEVVIMPDALEAPLSPAERAVIEERHLRSIIYLPLMIEDRKIGVLILGSVGTKRQFIKDEIDLLGTFTSQAALAIENARLFSALEEELRQRERFEQELRIERDRAQRYLDTVEAIIIALDREGRVTLINRKGCRLLGYEEDEIIGRHWFRDMLPQPDGMERVFTFFQQLIAGDTEPVEYFENPIMTREGEVVEIAWHSSLLHDDEGEVVGTLSAGEDITERKLGEQRMQILQHRLESLWSIARMTDKTHTELSDRVLEEIIDLTGSRYAFYGFMDDDEVTMTVYSWSSETMQDCAIHDEPLIFQIEDSGIWGNAVRERRPIIYNDFSQEIPNKKGIPEGHVALERLMVVPIIHDERVYSVAAVANKEEDYTRDDIEQVNAFVSSIESVIVNRKMGEILKESEAMLQQSQSVARIGHYTFDIPTGAWTSSRVLDEIFGIDKGYNRTVEGWLDIIHPEDREAMGRYLAEDVVEQKRAFDREYRIVRVADGAERWVHGLGQLELDVGGAPVRMFGTIQDITERKQGEEAVRSSEERYRSIFDDAPVPVWEEDFSAGKAYLDELRASGVDDLERYLDANPEELVKLMSLLRVIDVNEASVKVLGAADKESLIRELPAYFTDESLQLFQEEVVALYRGETAYTAEAPLLDANGERKEFEVTLKVLPGHEESLSRILVSFMDITERKRSGDIVAVRARLLEFAAGHTLAELQEEILNQAERLTGSSIGFFHLVDEDGKSLTLQQWSKRTKAEFCRSEGERMHYDIDQAGVWVDCVRERAPVIHNDYASLPHRKGMPAGHAEVVRELVAPVMRGNRVVAIIGVGNKATDYTGADAVMITLLADLAWDISESHKADMALRESELRYRNIIETSPMAVHMYELQEDDRLVFTGANPAADTILGLDNSQFIGKTIEEAFPALRQTEVPRRYREAARDGSHWYTEQIEYHEGRISGAFEVYAFQAEPMKMVALFNDVTFRRQAEEERERLREQLARSQRMEAVGRLAGGVAHDFNNMLGVIMGHAEIARSHIDPNDPVADDISEITKAARRSADLTRQLLAYARRQATSPQVLKLDDTVASMLGMLRRMIGEDIGLEWRPQPELWPVMIDPSQVDQLLSNLLVNARDAIAGTGTVVLSVENVSVDEAAAGEREGFAPGDYVKVTVSDDGRGIDEETLAHIFEPFFTTKSMTEGTGLGLATVYGIVKQNDGYIGVESEPGKGTAFEIFLPRHQGEPAEALPVDAAEPVRGAGETVLLVEDEPAVLRMTETMLKRMGYAVLPAASPEEALELARTNADVIDVLLTDVVMPGMGGRELADRLAEIAPAAVCLFMSGYTADVISNHGVIDDGISFLQKPFTTQKLARALREALGQNGG